MKFFVIWLVILGSTLIGLAGAMWFSGTIGLYLVFTGIISLIIACAIQLKLIKLKSQDAKQKTNAIPEGHGGKGGNAEIKGNGIAIGGPGGRAGKYGVGGDGGCAKIEGDGDGPIFSIAVGGAGGSAGDYGIWRPPAKSGYEILQRQLGLPIDPFLRQFGRGGAGAGYEPKLKFVEQLRLSYFKELSKSPKTIFEDINAVPLNYLNDELIKKEEFWRVRIVDDEYEFFIPEK